MSDQGKPKGTYVYLHMLISIYIALVCSQATHDITRNYYIIGPKFKMIHVPLCINIC